MEWWIPWIVSEPDVDPTQLLLICLECRTCHAPELAELLSKDCCSRLEVEYCGFCVEP